MTLDRDQGPGQGPEAEAAVIEAARRQRLFQFAAGGVFIAVIIVVVAVIVGANSGKSGGVPESAEESEITKLLGGIPQEGMLLGDPDAPVKIAEYGDLQCPWCRANAEEVTPEAIETAVRNGEANISFNQFIIIGPQSIPAGEAAIAAGAQGKGWNFVELFYRNQGEENSGYVTEEFIETIGKSAGIPDLKKWNQERKSGKYKRQLEAETKKAEKLGFGGTPSFAIEGPKSKGLEVISTPETPGQLEEEIEKVQ